MAESETTPSSRDRLLASGKTLFGRQGYEQTSTSAIAREAIVRVLTLIMETFGRDHDIAFLFLFEGRRVRGNTLALSRGFLRFYDLLHQLVERGQRDGSFRNDVSMNVIASALMGAAEGMIRDRMIAERNNQPAGYEEAAIRRTFVSMVNALGQPESR